VERRTDDDDDDEKNADKEEEDEEEEGEEDGSEWPALVDRVDEGGDDSIVRATVPADMTSDVTLITDATLNALLDIKVTFVCLCCCPYMFLQPTLYPIRKMCGAYVRKCCVSRV